MKVLLSFFFIFLIGSNLSYAAESMKRDTLRLFLPGYSWAVEADFKNFKVEAQAILPGFKGQRIQAYNDLTQLRMSVHLVPGMEKRTPAEIRDLALENLKKSIFELSDIKKYSQGSFAFTEYVIRNFRDMKNINQKNIFIYLVKDDTYIDFHLSKMDFKKAEIKFFQDYIDSIRLIHDFTPSSYDNVFVGSYYYREKDYQKAFQYYYQALKQEDQSRALPEELWLVLVDNLAMSLGILGDLKNAKAILEYGIARKPEYPNFYYTLACAYAEGGDLDNALVNLRKAFQYKENRIKGESMPDPAKDSSFARYLKDRRFQEFLQTIQK